MAAEPTKGEEMQKFPYKKAITNFERIKKESKIDLDQVKILKNKWEELFKC